MRSRSRIALDAIRELRANPREYDGLPVEEFAQFLDPEDRFFEELTESRKTGEKYVDQKHARA